MCGQPACVDRQDIKTFQALAPCHGATGSGFFLAILRGLITRARVNHQDIKKRKASARARGRQDLASDVSPWHENTRKQSSRRGEVRGMTQSAFRSNNVD
jgi:hypothetical protein